MMQAGGTTGAAVELAALLKASADSSLRDLPHSKPGEPYCIAIMQLSCHPLPALSCIDKIMSKIDPMKSSHHVVDDLTGHSW